LTTGDNQGSSVPGEFRDKWWDGVLGLDPRFPAPDIATAAAAAVIAYTIHLSISDTSLLTRPRDHVFTEAKRWRGWLAEPVSENEAYLRRLAFRGLCDAGVDVRKILDAAKVLLNVYSPPPRRKESTTRA
jgi:hypothetical protein